MRVCRHELPGKHFLETHPECADALRYLLTCDAGQWVVLQDVCEKNSISIGTWRSCYGHLGPRTGACWIETMIEKIQRRPTTLVRIVPDSSIRDKLREILLGGSDA